MPARGWRARPRLCALPGVRAESGRRPVRAPSRPHPARRPSARRPATAPAESDGPGHRAAARPGGLATALWQADRDVRAAAGPPRDALPPPFVSTISLAAQVELPGESRLHGWAMAAAGTSVATAITVVTTYLATNSNTQEQPSPWSPWLFPVLLCACVASACLAAVCFWLDSQQRRRSAGSKAELTKALDDLEQECQPHS